MPIPNSRTQENGHPTIDLEKCTGCGLCIDVCSDGLLSLVNEKATVKEENSTFGCIGCGHCMAICASGAIEVAGRCIAPGDIFPISKDPGMASYDSLLKLYQYRRSVRDFKDEPVSQELIDKILYAASQSPMGIPPSDVRVLVLNGKEKVFEFSKDFCEYLESLKWMVTPLGIALLRPIMGKDLALMFRDFAKPLIYKYTESMKNGENVVMYNAPAALYFYGSAFADPADCIIAATYAMHAAESLGLGTCMLGGIHPFIQSGGKAKKFREKQGIRNKSREGLFLIFGHPRIKYKQGINRTFANVDTLN